MGPAELPPARRAVRVLPGPLRAVGRSDADRAQAAVGTRTEPAAPSPEVGQTGMSEWASVEDVHELAAGACRTSPSRGATATTRCTRWAANRLCSFAIREAGCLRTRTSVKGMRDVIVFWVPSEQDKQALVLDEQFAVLHHTAFQRSPVGVAASQPDRRAHPAGTLRSHRGRLAVSGVGATGNAVARRPGAGP